MGNQSSIQIRGKAYTVERTIAEGGFSLVYAIHDPKTNKSYALKRIYCDDAQQVKQAQWEIQVHRSIEHPNVMQLLDADIIGVPRDGIEILGIHFDNNPAARAALLLFPLFNRGSLHDSIMKADERQAPLSSEVDCLEIFAEVCLGLRAMHRKGWAHGDIKPHNVLLQSPELPEQQVGIPGQCLVLTTVLRYADDLCELCVSNRVDFC
jgi:serine/threonine kinase 16